MSTRDCACGQHERGARLFDKKGMPTESHWGDYCELGAGRIFRKGDTLMGAAPSDNGLALALSIVSDELDELEEWLRDRTDYDEDVNGHKKGNAEAEHWSAVQYVRKELARIGKGASK